MFVFRKILPYSPFCLIHPFALLPTIVKSTSAQFGASCISNKILFHIVLNNFIFYLLIVKTSFWFIYLFYLFIYLFFLQVLAIENKTASLNN